MSSNLWNDLGHNDDDKELPKEKIINFVKPFHIVKKSKQSYVLL